MGRPWRSADDAKTGAALTLTDDFFGLLQRIETASSVATVWSVFLAAANRAGFPMGLATTYPTVVNVAEHLLAENMPPGWVANFTARGYERHSPLVSRIARGPAFVWDLNDWEGRLSPIQQDWRDDYRATGFRRGMCIPINYNGERMGIVLGGPRYDPDPRDMLLLQLVGGEALRRMYDLAKTVGRNAAPALTAREAECLKWVAAGKTDWEIGQILSVSEKTVNHHVEAAKRKARAATRVQAVVVAWRLGMITL